MVVVLYEQSEPIDRVTFQNASPMTADELSEPNPGTLTKAIPVLTVHSQLILTGLGWG